MKNPLSKPTGLRVLLLGAACTSALVVVLIFAFLVYFSAPLWSGKGVVALLTGGWRPFSGEFGIFPMVAGSFILSITAFLISYPLALGLCSFANGAGPKWAAKSVLGLLYLMTGVPTVVYGFISAMLLVPYVRGLLGSGTGYSWMTASLTLALLITPTIALVIHSSIKESEKTLRPTAAALGFTPEQRLLYLTLPSSGRGLLAAGLLGFGRAAGDTMVALMVAGNAPIIPTSPAAPLRTLTSHIGLVVATDATSDAYQSLFAAGLLLFAFSVAVNLGARWAVQAGERG